MIVVNHSTNIGSVCQKPVLRDEIWGEIAGLVHHTNPKPMVAEHIAANNLHRASQDTIGTETEIWKDRI